MFRFLVLTGVVVLGIHGQAPALAREVIPDENVYYDASSLNTPEALCARNPNQTNGAKSLYCCDDSSSYNCNSFPSISFLFEADYLYWQARVDDLTYGFVWTTSGVDPDVRVEAGDRYQVNPESKSGVRLGIGLPIPYVDRVLFSARWTYYATAGDGRAVGGSNKYLMSPWTNPAKTAISNIGNAKYNMVVNIADFSLEHNLFASNELTITPLVGARCLWMNQDLNVTYSGGDFTLSPLYAHNENRLLGGGLRTGLSTEWNMGCGWSILGWSYIDLLWSKVKVHQDNIYGGDTNSIMKTDSRTFNPVFELFLGLSWESPLWCTNMRARIGWEEQVFLNAIQFNRYTQFTGQEDLLNIYQTGNVALGGLTVGLSIEY
ncbi:MAG: Lpg1974 family pore-forming outer membrane protein [Chlamydiales bacterium]